MLDLITAKSDVKKFQIIENQTLYLLIKYKIKTKNA